MTIRIHRSVVQGSDEWLQMRCGLITASEMKLLITPTLKVADNDKTRSHLYELAAQRITGYVEPQYVSDDMLRGHEDEIEACILYGQHFAPVDNVGFITNDRWGFALGYSPDGLVGEHGLVECKSRRQKFQIQTIVENIADGTCPADFVIQHQTALLVSERQWIDFISYSGGLPTRPVRIYPDPVVQEAIIGAAEAAEKRIARIIADYETVVAGMKLIATERRIEMEMII